MVVFVGVFYDIIYFLRFARSWFNIWVCNNCIAISITAVFVLYFFTRNLSDFSAAGDILILICFFIISIL